MRRYWRIYKTFFVSSFARELEFKANFFAKVAQNIVWIVFFLLLILVVYRNTESVAGWSRGEAFILAATCFVMNAVVSAFFMSLQEIPEQVRRGTLDFVITKPVDTQFWVSTRKFNFDQVGTLLAGLAMIVVGTVQAGIHPDALQWLGYLTLTAASTLLFYAFNMALMTLGIWLVRVDNLWVLGETVMQVARYPLDIYSTGLQRVLTYFVPLAFIATIPAKQLVKGFDPGMVGIGVAWSFGAFFFARWFWNYALSHYTSASS
ncbi:MAG: ABC-2 family transporter protein [Fimbriimonadaceae bacterium]|nr:ABC-2 family transporter protein [Fimbriimonadaceae bacterium]